MVTTARRDIFQAIADPTRREIIGMIAVEPLNVSAIAKKIRVSRPAISQQIRILEECGVVRIQQKGRERICYARLTQLDEVQAWIDKYKQFWNVKLDALEDFLDNIED